MGHGLSALGELHQAPDKGSEHSQKVRQRERGKGWKSGPSAKPRLPEEDVGLTIFIKQSRRRVSKAKR